MVGCTLHVFMQLWNGLGRSMSACCQANRRNQDYFNQNIARKAHLVTILAAFLVILAAITACGKEATPIPTAVSGATPTGSPTAGPTPTLTALSREVATEEWVRQFGSTGDDGASGVAADALGNLYVVGEIQGALPGQTQLGGRDAFVRKYDASGNELWTRQFGSSDSNRANDVAVDTAGGVYVVGDTSSAPGAERVFKDGPMPLCASMTVRATSFGPASSAPQILTPPVVWR